MIGFRCIASVTFQTVKLSLHMSFSSAFHALTDLTSCLLLGISCVNQSGIWTNYHQLLSASYVKLICCQHIPIQWCSLSPVALLWCLAHTDPWVACLFRVSMHSFTFSVSIETAFGFIAVFYSGIAFVPIPQWGIVNIVNKLAINCHNNSAIYSALVLTPRTHWPTMLSWHH